MIIVFIVFTYWLLNNSALYPYWRNLSFWEKMLPSIRNPRQVHGRGRCSIFTDVCRNTGHSYCACTHAPLHPRAGDACALWKVTLKTSVFSLVKFWRDDKHIFRGDWQVFCKQKQTISSYDFQCLIALALWIFQPIQLRPVKTQMG